MFSTKANLDLDNLKVTLNIQRKELTSALEQVNVLQQSVTHLEQLVALYDIEIDESWFMTEDELRPRSTGWSPRQNTMTEQVFTLLNNNPEGLKFVTIRDTLVPNPNPSEVEGVRCAVKTLVQRGWAEQLDRNTYRLKADYLK